MLRTLLEWKPLVTFLGGVVVGGLLVAGVQRREPAAVPSVSVAQQQAQRLVDSSLTGHRGRASLKWKSEFQNTLRNASL